MSYVMTFFSKVTRVQYRDMVSTIQTQIKMRNLEQMPISILIIHYGSLKKPRSAAKTESLPLRMSLSSNTSSCIKLAVWIISIISAKRLCSLVSSLVIECRVKILIPHNISRSVHQQIKLQGPHFKPTISAVALDTRNTKAGLILFPPAPKICSAADIKTGFSAPTI